MVRSTKLLQAPSTAGCTLTIRNEQDEESSLTLAKQHISGVAKETAAKTEDGKRLQDELGQIVAGQPHCANCHLSAVELHGRALTLTSCSTCKLFATCSGCPPKHTEQQCLHYSLVARLEQYRLDRFENVEDLSVIEPVAEVFDAHQYRPLSTYDDWTDFFMNVPVRGMRQEESSYFSEQFHAVLATDSSTISMTVLAALEASIPGLLEREYLSLHLVGATSREMRHLLIFEDILHMLPRLKHLHVVMCGPKLAYTAENTSDGSSKDLELDCCPSCSATGRRRTVALYNGFYHEYAGGSAYRGPNLAVLFHSGRSQEARDSWAPTTRLLVDRGINTVCTTYTEREAMEETAELDQLNARMIVGPEENKWRGLGPLPELLDGPEHSAYFLNYWWYIFKGKRS